MLKIFHLSTKLVINDSDIDKAFRSMQQGLIAKIKNYINKDF